MMMYIFNVTFEPVPEVKHWHGAVKEEAFAHLSLSVPAEGSSNEWCEPVTEEEYSKLPSTYKDGDWSYITTLERNTLF